MKTINQLRKLIAKEKELQLKRDKVKRKREEEIKLKKELFQLRHGKKIKIFKRVGETIKVAGGNLTHNVKGMSKSFNKKRKSKSGVGGFLQRIADNQ